MFLKNKKKNKIRRSKVTDYAALSIGSFGRRGAVEISCSVQLSMKQVL